MNIPTKSSVYKKYRIVRYIGSGGFSDVYQVEPLRGERGETYALKYSTAKRVSSQSKMSEADFEIVKQRFLQEINVYKKIKSKRVAAYIDSHVDENEQYLVMEFVNGKSLKDILQINHKLIPRIAVDYAIQIAEGISELHSSKIIHRDIKSNNIMITPDKEVKIIDFGLALGDDSQRLTQTQKVVGSVYYMAPELCKTNSMPTERSDIYALGILIFELLTGTYPIAGKDPRETLKKQINSPMPDITKTIQVPQALANVITRATAKEPAKRYASMWDMREDLKTCLDRNKYFEKPLDLRKIKPKKSANDVINSKAFLVGSLVTILILLLLGLILIVIFV